MRVKSYVHVLAKVKKAWKESQGVERLIYSANIMQEQGEIIDTIRLTQEQFDMIESNKNYVITADYATGKNGGYLRLASIAPEK